MASQTYPTNQVLAVIDDPAAADQAVESLIGSGFARELVTRMTAADQPARPRRWTRLVRIFQFMSMDQGPDFHIYEAAMREGRAVVSVRVKGRAEIERARDVLVAAGGHFINYFGRLQTEEITQWRGPEPKLPEYLRR